MNDHDSSFDAQRLWADLNSVKKISPEFNDLSLDMQEILKESSNPAFLAALLYKLVKEREETNRILSRMEQKFVRIEELLLRNNTNQFASSNPNTEELLPEPDQHIMQLVDEQITVSAQDVTVRLAYKKSNAASQRLNKLVREGRLKSVRSGKKVFFMRPNASFGSGTNLFPKGALPQPQA